MITAIISPSSDFESTQYSTCLGYKAQTLLLEIPSLSVTHKSYISYGYEQLGLVKHNSVLSVTNHFKLSLEIDIYTNKTILSHHRRQTLKSDEAK